MPSLLVPRMKPSIGAPLNRGLGRLSRPALWLPMREGSGTKLFDASGYGRHGTLTGGPTWAPGRRGKCLSFDGSNDYVPTADIDLDYVTVSAWVNTTHSDVGVIVNKTYSGNVVPFSLSLVPGASYAGMAFYDGSGWQASDAPLAGIASGWHHVVGTYDGVTLRYYVDAAIKSSSVVARGGPLPRNDVVLDVGRYANDGVYFNGLIDDVRVYPFALTASEIQTLYRDPWRQFGTFVDREVYAPVAAPPPTRSGRSMMMAAGS